jgi:ComF family protein
MMVAMRTGAPEAGAAFSWRGLPRLAADLILPPVCVVCRAPISSQGLLCAPCFCGIDFIAAPLCQRLGVPLPYDTGEPYLSVAAIAASPDYDRALAVARYSQTMRDLIQSFKYRDRHDGLRLFTTWLARAGAELLADADVLVPVPLYRSRLWSRRFNQSALLVRGLERDTGIPADCFVLRRTRRTASQVGFSAAQRKRNVAGAFKISPSGAAVIPGKSVLLIDDVITTGATVEACARVLKRAGASRVDVLALARAVEPAAFVH